MSHVSTIVLKLDDKRAVMAAAKDLGLDVAERSVADLGDGSHVFSDLVLTAKDVVGRRVQVALIRKGRTYHILSDPYTLRRCTAFGAHGGGDFSKLIQRASLKKLEAAARKQGYKIGKASVDSKNGDIRVYLW